MARSLKMTPFARFFFVIIILAPLAYIGASYYRGEDGLQNIKNLFGGNKQQTTQTKQNNNTQQKKDSDYTLLKQDVNELRLRIEALERENKEQAEKLRRLEMRK